MKPYLFLDIDGCLSPYRKQNTHPYARYPGYKNIRNQNDKTNLPPPVNSYDYELDKYLMHEGYLCDYSSELTSEIKKIIPSVDFYYLTTWNKEAPYVWDKLINPNKKPLPFIENLGLNKFRIVKKLAKKNPIKPIIFIDDQWGHKRNCKRFVEKYSNPALFIRPNEYRGINQLHIKQIKDFIKENNERRKKCL
jgi:hypothetical protein